MPPDGNGAHWFEMFCRPARISIEDGTGGPPSTRYSPDFVSSARAIAVMVFRLPAAGQAASRIPHCGAGRCFQSQTMKSIVGGSQSDSRSPVITCPRW